MIQVSEPVSMESPSANSRAFDPEVFTFLSRLLPVVDAINYVIVILLSTRPLLTFLLAIAFPIVGVGGLRISQKIKRNVNTPQMLIIVCLHFLICAASGRTSPAWLICIPGIVASVFLLPEMKLKLVFLFLILLAASAGNYVSGKDPINIVSAAAALTAFSILMLRTYQFLQKMNRRLERQNAELQQERAKSDHLLENILPGPIAERMKRGETKIVDQFEVAGVLFADIVGFTKFSTSIEPKQVVSKLDTIFSEFDHIIDRNGLEKIKTIGDAYMAVTGIPQPQPRHLEALARAALEMQAAMDRLNRTLAHTMQVRIGLHAGSVVAGTIGERKFAYDLWGDTVNTASRMESHGEAGRIHCSQVLYESLKNDFDFEGRGPIEIRGKGSMQTYFLIGTRHDKRHGFGANSTTSAKLV
jgi:class 3 adenylate cyclase